MQKALAPLTVLVLVLTGLSLNQSGWLKANPPPRTEVGDVFSTEAALRHKHCLPNHWRALVLQKD